MRKSRVALIALLAVSGIGFLSIQREQSRRESLSPAELAAEDSARAVLLRSSADSTKQARERTPGYQKGLAEFALKQRARDPESIQFRNEQMYTRGDTLVVCGEVNSKNGFGGYTGFKPFVSVRGAVVTEADAKELGAAVVQTFFDMCADRSAGGP